MEKITVTFEITIDEENIAELYPNYKHSFKSPSDFADMLIAERETSTVIDMAGKSQIDKFGYNVVMMEKKEGAWEK